MPRVICRFVAALACALPFAAAPMAEDSLDAPPVILMELFTSQGCYSCPPAEELLGAEYAPRDDILPLELHVDYWDDLIYGLAGSWKDPFSQNAFTKRQVAYNRRMGSSYQAITPQFVIHGTNETAGSNKTRIDAAISKVQQAQVENDDGIRWRFDNDDDGKWRAHLRGTAQPGGELYYAIFRRRAITEVPSGENKGKTLTNTNVVLVLQSRPLSAGRELSLPKLKDGEDCAVWLQNGIIGKVLAAARCPQQQQTTSS